MTLDAELSPLVQADILFIGPFARRIWREHYAGIISASQIEHSRKLTPLTAAPRWAR